ncbi:MAG: exosortase, partial [Opitutus sp.]
IDATMSIASLIGVDVVRSGTQLFAPDGRYQYDVAAACSGVRSLMALSALSLLIGYVNFATITRRGLMLLLCFPLTYVGNVVRVVVIVIAAHLGGPRWGALMHDLMGYGVFAIVLGGVFAAVGVLQRIWPESARLPDVASGQPAEGGPTPPDEPSENRPQIPPARRGRPALATAVLLAALAVMEMFALARLSKGSRGGEAGVKLAADAKNPIDLPAFIGTEWVGRRTEVTELERQILPADTGFSRRTYVSVKDRSHAVFVSIVLSGRDRTSIHRPEICLLGQGWTIDRRQLVAAEPPLPERTLLGTTLIEPRTHRELKTIVAYWFVNTDGVVATHWQRFFRDAWNRLRHGRADRWAYVLVQADAQDGEAPALIRMKTVLAEVLPLISRR